MLEYATNTRTQPSQANDEARDYKPSKRHGSSVEVGLSARATDEPAIEGAWRDLFYFTARRDVPLLLLAIFCSIGASVGGPAEAFLIGKVFDEFISYAAGRLTSDQLLANQQKWILWLSCMAIGSWLFHTLEFSTWMLIGEKHARRARQQLYATMTKESISWYDMQKQGIAALLPQLETQIADVKIATSQPFGALIAMTSTALISLGQAFYNSWSLTLVTLATSPLIVVVMALFGAGIQAAFDKQRTSLSEAQKLSLDALSAIDTVKCFNAENIELERYKSKIATGASHYLVVTNKIALQMGCLTFLVQAMFVQAFYFGGVLISRGEKTTAQVVTTFFSAIAAFQAVQAILPQLVVFEKGRSSAAMLKTLLNAKEESSGPAEHHRGLCPMDCEGTIRLREVTFSYPALSSQQALKDVSVTFPGGRLTFVVGKSGSGKSTIGQLLVRFYAPGYGQVLLDDQDLVDLDEKWLRSKITLVEQTSTLFNDTILANIQLGNPKASEADVQTAVEFALLQSLVSDLPDGLNTLVGGSGASLSGGQCQRVALARARIRDTPILILDESTSALDKISRDLIIAAIRKWRLGKTTIVITHDIGQVDADDYAIVMQDGQLVQEGYRQDMEVMYESPFHQIISQQQAKLDSTQLQAHLLNGRDSQMMQTQLHSKAHYRQPKRFSALSSSRSLGLPGIPISLASLTVSPEIFRTSMTSFDDRSRYKVSPVSTTDDIRASVYAERRDDVQTIQRHSMARLEDHMMKAGQIATSNRVLTLVRDRFLVSDGGEVVTANSDREALNIADQSPRAIKSLFAIFSTIWPVLPWNGRLHLLIGFWGGTVHAVCSPVFGYILAKLIGLYAINDDHSRQSLEYSLGILALAVADGVHFYLCRYMLDKAAQEWVDRSRVEALRRLLHQPKAFFDRPENVIPPIVQELDRSGEEMRNLLGRFAGLMYIATVIICSSIIWALATQWKMTLIALAAGPYVFVTTYVYSKGSEHMESLIKHASVAVSLAFDESFRNIRVVRALLLEPRFKTRFANAVANAMQVGRRRAWTTGLLYGVSDSASAFSIAFVFYIGSRLVSSGADIMAIVQVFVVLIIAITNVTAILGYIPQIGSAKVTANRILELANIEEQSHESSGDVRLTSFGTAEFKNVTFAYPSRVQSTALNNITITIKPGHSIAIVGGSGSGKSTIAKLILKLYEAPHDETTDGSQASGLRISGRYIQDIETTSLRNVIGVVSQSNQIFAGTVTDNITYGLPEGSSLAEPDNVAFAVLQAGALDFINSLPAGFETRIGDGGTGLSGGQIQRIAIARALVRQPQVIILDEATSALDVESAATIRATIDQLIAGRIGNMTVIIITHNRDMMELAEQVAVLDNGRLVQYGRYKDLISRPGPLLHLLSSGAWATTQDGNDLG